MRIILSSIFICLTFTVQAQISTLYVGGFTDGEGKGIYTFDFNSQTGALKNQKLVAKANKPSYLVISPDKKTVYAATASDNYLNTNSGAIASFTVLKDGMLEKNAEISSYGETPCHLSLNDKGDKLVVSNYSGGTFSLYSIHKKGQINTVIQVENLNYDSIKAHTHAAQFFKDQLFVADLGLNNLIQYTFKDSSYVETQSIPMLEKSGPRHFVMTENAEFIYVINEYGGTISTLVKEGNTYIRKNDVSTLRQNYKGINACADIHLSPDEKFLYGSNRGENTIVVFERNKKNGDLKKVQTISCHGDWPRNFTLGPKGNFLLVANRKSNNISIFLIDKASGELTYIYDVKSPNPTCLQF
ncbi:lactonase family protein [Flavicella sp.]|uniref:lactonase family protein n=1 Tax=Flavicella sp. TaxID=2957742 RepID=UPI0030179BA0